MLSWRMLYTKLCEAAIHMVTLAHRSPQCPIGMYTEYLEKIMDFFYSIIALFTHTG